MADGALAGATAEVREGAVVSCTAELAGEPTASVAGSLDAWISAILGRDPGGLELAGASPLAAGLIDGVRRYLRLS